jgi:uncharacterized membrane protein YkoI
MTQPIHRGIAAIAALALLAVGPAQGGERKKRDHDAARAALARHEILPLPRILALAAQRAPGDVLKVELEDEKGQLIYEVKILGPNGQVREIKLDARTGGVVKIEDD